MRARALLVLFGIILALQFALFAWSLTAFFGSDGIFYLARKLDHPADVVRFLTSPDDRGQFRPLTLVLFSFLLYPVFELDPTGYHLVPLTFHFANTVLGFFVLRKLVPGQVAVLAATLYFGLHPINFFVSYSIAFLPDFTYGFFYLVSLLGFLSYQDTGRRSRLLVGIAAFVLALLCKEAAVTLPFVVAVALLARSRSGFGLLQSWRRLLPPALACAFILAAYLVFLITIKGGALFPQNPGDPYRSSFTLSTLAGKTQYGWWALGLPSGTGTLKGHPRAIELLASVLPDRLLEAAGEISNLFVRPRRLARLVLMIPLTCVFLFGVAALWRRQPMVLGGLAWFLIALTPVLFLAVKTMRHNLYIPIIGVAAVMGLAVEEVHRRVYKRSPKRAAALALGLFSLYVAASALAVVGFWKHAWPVQASIAAKNSLEDLRRAHPVLARNTTLYFLDNRRDDLIWFFEGGNLFRIFYRDPTLRTLFEQSGDRLPEDHLVDPNLLILAYDDGHLHDVTQWQRSEATDRTGYRLLDHFDPSKVAFNTSERYPIRNYLNSLSGGPVFPYSFARADQWRPALVTLAGVSVELRTPRLERDSVLRFGVAMVHDLGDGAEGRISFQSGEKSELIYARSLDPAHREADRRWFDERLDLGRFAGQAGTLRLECRSGSAGDTAADWFAWSTLKIEPR